MTALRIVSSREEQCGLAALGVTGLVVALEMRLKYKYNFVDIWNNIPTHIKSKTSVSLFKKSGASWLIDSY